MLETIELKKLPVAGAPADGKSCAPALSGMLEGTLIATSNGWRRVENLRAGDAVLTLDNGPCRVLGVIEVPSFVRPSRLSSWPKLVPDGVLGNRGTMRLLPDQIVGIESEAAHLAFGDSVALMPARALEGWQGIVSVPPEVQVRAWRILLQQDQVLYAGGGVMIFCPSAVAPVGPKVIPPYQIRTSAEAKALLG